MGVQATMPQPDDSTSSNEMAFGTVLIGEGEKSIRGLMDVGKRNNYLGRDDYSPFPSRMFALLYILLHVPRFPVS